MTERHIEVLGKWRYVTRQYTKGNTPGKVFRWLWHLSSDGAWRIMLNCIPDQHFPCWKVYINVFRYTMKGELYPRRKRKCPAVPKKS